MSKNKCSCDKCNNDRQGFLNYCEAIQGIQNDVDKFLNSAKLQRNEAQSKLTNDQYYWLSIVKTWAMVIVVLLIGFFTFLIFKS